MCLKSILYWEDVKVVTDNFNYIEMPILPRMHDATVVAAVKYQGGKYLIIVAL